MPYLGQVTITGPEPAPDRRQHFLDALSTAVTEAWRSMIAVAVREYDTESSAEDWEPSERKVLDHRIVGYPGGAAVITLVLSGDGLDFEEAAAALTSLGRHLTTWSPELLEYTLHKIEVSKLAQRWDEDNWLAPLDHYSSCDKPI